MFKHAPAKIHADRRRSNELPTTDQSIFLARFMAKVNIQPNGCWIWTGSTIKRGYGNFWFRGKVWRSHRVSFTLFRGEIPRDAQIDHQCHVPASCAGGEGCPHRRCVNPDHLALSTNKENGSPGRSNRANCGARERARTHCTSGHPYDASNTMISKLNKRVCRECNRLGSAAWRASRIANGLRPW